MIRPANFWLALVILAILVGLAVPAWADEATGNIMAVQMDKHQIVVMDNNARPKTFHVAKDCAVLINNQESQLSELKPGDHVRVVFERQEEMLMAREVLCNR